MQRPAVRCRRGVAIDQSPRGSLACERWKARRTIACRRADHREHRAQRGVNLAEARRGVIGAVMGKDIGGEAVEGALSRSRDEIVDLVDRARRNPQLARELQMKATRQNLAFAPRVKRMAVALAAAEVQPPLPGPAGQ